jgi:hypothetical protein
MSYPALLSGTIAELAVSNVAVPAEEYASAEPHLAAEILQMYLIGLLN